MEQPSPSLIAALGQVVVTGPLASALPLEHTSVSAQVTGPCVSVTVTQRFGNPIAETAELEYLFPLPHEAAVVDFELLIGTRRVRGDVQEIEQARQVYYDARRKGQHAGLLEQRRPNLVAVRLANVLPGETIQTTLRYQQKMRFDDGAFEFIYPMGITPKYDRPGHLDEAEGVHAPVAMPGEPIGTVDISVAVDAGMPVGEPASPSHPIETVRLDERRFQVRLAGEHIPNRDFVLRYGLESDQPTAGIWLSKREDEETFLALLTPPVLEEDYQPLRREFVFVLDRSGSMSVEPIAQARNALRACLRTLRPDDAFRILLFDDRLEWYRQEPSPVTQAEIDRADAYLSAVQSRGGTEIIGALEAVLSLPADPNRTRFVVFLTDGAVSAEKSALEMVQQKLGETRLFTFGIGSSVNRALLSRLAKIGRGAAEFLQLDEDIEGAVIRFQDRVTFPVLTGLFFEWHNARVWDVYPTRIPDLFSGQPVEICGKLQRTEPGPVSLWVRGVRSQQDVTMQLPVPGTNSVEPVLERVWATARIQELLETEDLNLRKPGEGRAEVIHLALSHHLITPYTAFVAVDEDVANPGGKSQKLPVAQPLPDGVVFDQFDHPHINALASMALPPSPASQVLRAKSMPSLYQMDAKSNRTEPMEMPPSFLREDHRIPIETVDYPKPGDTEGILRWLARKQNLDGSWDGDVERTSAAVLAFVRRGHTTRSGSFRSTVRKAVAWLEDTEGSSFPALVRLLALHELASATGQPAHQALAKKTLSIVIGAHDTPALVKDIVLKLVKTGDPGRVDAVQKIKSLDDLRLAAILQWKAPVDRDLFDGEHADLVFTWSSAF